MNKGKKLIIFDFDDTLIYTNDIFVESKKYFYQMMQEFGLYDDNLPDKLNEFDIKNVKTLGGLKKECFPLALKQTYRYYCKQYQRPYSESQGNSFLEMGYRVYSEPVRIVPGALDLLEELSGYNILVLLTQGDGKLQRSRIKSSGICKYFHSYHIVDRKNEIDFLNILERYEVPKSSSWSIGNSIRYDINPAIKAGINAIHVEIPCWDYELVDATGEYYSVNNLKDCKKYLY